LQYPQQKGKRKKIMSIEEKLREYILAHYKSIREFTKKVDMPYTTVDGILKRGVANSSIGNVLKICKALNISADELANNRIVTLNKEPTPHVFIANIPDMIEYMKNNPEEFYDLTVDDKPLDNVEWETMLNSMTLIVEFIRNKRKRIDMK
jgi:hypothetical protein